MLAAVLLGVTVVDIVVDVVVVTGDSLLFVVADVTVVVAAVAAVVVVVDVVDVVVVDEVVAVASLSASETLSVPAGTDFNTKYNTSAPAFSA